MFKWLAAAATTVIVLPLAVLLLVAAEPMASEASPSMVGGPSVQALDDIPPAYLALYMGAARTCPGLPWAVLAGIGKTESDHGRSTDPGAHSGTNAAGAEGPMQFEPATFAPYAFDGDHDRQLSPYDPADAVYTAAAMLCANGTASGTRPGSGGLTMPVLTLALTVHHLAAHAVPLHLSGLAGGVPNPAPKAPPGLAGRVNTLLSWWKWGALVAGVFGLIGCGAMMAIGRRNRSNLAATGIPWVLAGLTLIALSSGIVGVFM